MKKKAKKAIVESGTEEENYRVPEYKTVITFYSKDQLNITLSKCGLIMLNNLAEVRKVIWNFNFGVLVWVNPLVKKSFC